MPKILVAAVAIAYSFAWLMWAARVSKAAGIAPFVYAGTSAVILVPMLWEETLHFHAFASSVTACVLAAFVGLASALVWRRESSQVLWLSYGAAAATAVALSVASHAMLPFAVVLLLIVLLSEFARILGHARPMWPLVALVADAAIWGMIFIYSGPPNARMEYPELSVAALVFPACLLFAINATSVSLRAILKEKKIGIFDIVQVMIAFGLAISVVLIFAPSTSTLLGIACLALSAATYFASFRLLRSQAEMRNFATFSLWSAALLVAGALWSLPHAGAGVLLAVAGLVAYAVAPRIDSTMLEWHGVVFLCAATAIAGVAQYIYRALASSLPGRPELAVWIVGSAAVAAYAVGSDAKSEEWTHQVLCLLTALLAAAAVSDLVRAGCRGGCYACRCAGPASHRIPAHACDISGVVGSGICWPALGSRCHGAHGICRAGVCSGKTDVRRSPPRSHGIYRGVDFSVRHNTDCRSAPGTHGSEAAYRCACKDPLPMGR